MKHFLLNEKQGEQIATNSNLSLFQAKVVDPSGKTVPMGETGELWMRSFNNMTGYWEDPHGTENILTRDYWIKTG